MLATLPGANGWGTLERSLPVLLQAGYLDARRVSITLVNIEPVRSGPVHSRFTLVQGDGCDLSAYADRAFHVAHSNSVIEHVGDPRYLLVCESFCYRHFGTSQDVIRELDFNLLKGEWIALVGESGVGKSTLVDLLIGQLQPREACIQWPVSGAARAGIGYASAVTTLIPGTLRDNVAFLGENHSDSQLREALGIASIDSLLERMPEGLDTPVEIFEQRISSGERQRIGLARALLHAKSLLIP